MESCMSSPCNSFIASFGRIIGCNRWCSFKPYICRFEFQEMLEMYFIKVSDVLKKHVVEAEHDHGATVQIIY